MFLTGVSQNTAYATVQPVLGKPFKGQNKFTENVITQTLPFAESKQHYKKFKTKQKQKQQKEWSQTIFLTGWGV